MLRTIIANTGSNLVLMVVKVGLVFVMTPVLVHTLGNYDYGIWELISAVLGYMGLMDLGLRPTASRFAAFRRAHGDNAGLESLLATATTFMFAAAVIAATILIAWALISPESLSEEGNEGRRYAIVLGIISVQVLFTFPGFMFESFLEGYQRYSLKNNITIANSLIGAAIILTFIDQSEPLILLAGVNAAGRAIKYLLFLWLIQRWVRPAVRLRPSKASMATLRELLVFGGKSFVYGAAGRITVATNRFIIASFLGPASLIFYTLPAALLKRITTLRMTLTHAFMPAFTDLAASGRKDQIHGIFINASVIVTGLLVLLLIGVVGLGADFIGVWVGQQYVADARILLPIMATTAFFGLINPFANRLLMALDEHGIIAKAAPLGAIVNLGLSVALAPVLGLPGVALGSLVPVMVVQIYVLRQCCQLLELTLPEFLSRTVFPLALPSAIAALLCIGLRSIIPPNDYASIFGIASCMTLGYGAAYWFVSLGSRERHWLIEGSRRLRPRRS